MKNHIKSLLLVAFMLGTVIQAWGQASTQGKEFWVSSSIVCSPSNGKGISPYIAVSAEKECTVTITDYQGNSVIKTGASGQVLQNMSVSAGSWTEFGTNVNTDPTKGPIQAYLEPAKWYPINTKEPAKVCDLAGQKNMYGLHITATENISVYVILRGESSMDASNILPLTALGAEYYVQDYEPEAHNDKSWSTNAGNMVSVTTILGTEDGTKVDITPSNKTFDNHPAGTTYTIELNKGQTYYLISQKEQQLAGTHIEAQNNRKIAIYTGLPLTRLPNGISARDALFEQPMPVEYWGTQFIVTRSLGKNGNLIGITASNNGTEIKLDGYSQDIYIDKGETYYIMLQNAGKPQDNKPGTSHVDKTIIGDVLYIETSCPCEVYNYDTGNAYVGKEKDASGTVINELVDGQKGDPSSVWVSPLQQKINRITFGACYTDLTKAHFLNVITETATCQNTTLTALYGASTIDRTSTLVWQTVPGNPKYSYARAQIGDANTKQYSIFRLENKRSGFIATVYGNGNDESYAYSAGSAAVELGVNIGEDNETFTNGYRSDTKFCLGTELKFDAKVGTDDITRVDWDFGDGTTDFHGEPVTYHTYNTPAWYDVSARLYGRQACTDEDEQELGSIAFSFRVWRHDTVIVEPEKDCLSPERQADTIREKGQEYLEYLLTHPQRTILNPDAPCYEDRQLSVITYGLETLGDSIAEDRDSVWVHDRWYFLDKEPKLPADGIVTWEEENANEYNCKIYVTCTAHIISCLGIDIQQESLHTCLGENLLINYTKTKGDIDGNAVFTIDELPSFREEIEIPSYNISGTIDLPIAGLEEPGYYTARLFIPDTYCSDQSPEFTFPIAVYYPTDIFANKFGNTLAVYAPGNKGNKGYNLTGFQWYRNDQIIIGATNAVYTSEDPFTAGDIYHVELTNSDGVTLPSCTWTVPGTDVTNNAPNQAPAAEKKLINQRIRIVIDNRTYDVYGQRVE